MIVKNHSISTDFLRVIVLFLVTCALATGHANAQDFDKKIVGRWYSRSDVELPEEGFKNTSHLVQEYYPNGTMTEERQVISKFKDSGAVSSCYIIGDYSWSISGNVLYQKLLATSVTVDFVTVNGEDASQLDNGQKVLNIGQKGCAIFGNKKGILKTFSFKIIKIDDKENLYSQVDSDGKEFMKKIPELNMVCPNIISEREFFKIGVFHVKRQGLVSVFEGVLFSYPKGVKNEVL